MPQREVTPCNKVQNMEGLLAEPLFKRERSEYAQVMLLVAAAEDILSEPQRQASADA